VDVKQLTSVADGFSARTTSPECNHGLVTAGGKG
jgi:hypothetical protein